MIKGRDGFYIIVIIWHKRQCWWAIVWSHWKNSKQWGILFFIIFPQRWRREVKDMIVFKLKRNVCLLLCNWLYSTQTNALKQTKLAGFPRVPVKFKLALYPQGFGYTPDIKTFMQWYHLHYLRLLYIGQAGAIKGWQKKAFTQISHYPFEK